MIQPMSARMSKNSLIGVIFCLLVTNLLFSCANIDAGKVTMSDLSDSWSKKNLDLDFEVISSGSGLEYDVVVDNTHPEPTVVVHSLVNEEPAQIESRISLMSNIGLNNLVDIAFLRQNTEYQISQGNLRVIKIYKTHYFGDRIFSLSLGSNISHLINKRGLNKKKSGEKSGGCLAKIEPEYVGGYGRISCSFTAVTSLLTAYLTPYYCVNSYRASANLISGNSGRVIESYQLEEDIKRISWLFLPFSRDETLKVDELNKVDYEVQKKIANAIIDKALKGAEKFEECQKSPSNKK